MLLHRPLALAERLSKRSRAGREEGGRESVGKREQCSSIIHRTCLSRNPREITLEDEAALCSKA